MKTRSYFSFMLSVNNLILKIMLNFMDARRLPTALQNQFTNYSNNLGGDASWSLPSFHLIEKHNLLVLKGNYEIFSVEFTVNEGRHMLGPIKQFLLPL